MAPCTSYVEAAAPCGVFRIASDLELIMDKKTALLTQVVMTFIMAATMSGLMSLIHTCPSMEWLKGWPLQFITPWPIAFVLTMVAWPASMALTFKMLKRSGARAAQPADEQAVDSELENARSDTFSSFSGSG